MSLLAPLFLAGLAAIAVPILVHLVHKEKSIAERFPSAMFLRREPYRAMARQRLRHLFLFAMRVLALALLALGFSRPFFTRDIATAAAVPTGKDVAIVLDRSASMGYGDRWSRARAAVERTLGGIGANDRAALIVFDTRAAQVAPLSTDRQAIRQALGTERVSTRSTRYVPAMQLARRVLGEGNRVQREVVLISDFQRSGWDVRDNLLSGGERLTPVDVSGEDVANVAWRSASVERDSAATGDAVRVVGRIANTGPMRRAVRVTLAIGPREIAEQRVDLPADGGATVTFVGVRAPAAANEARLVVHGDAYAMDDTLRLMLERPRQVAVLLVEASGGDRSFFLREALALGAAPSFDVRSRSRNALAVADLVDRDVVVLHDAGWPGGAVGARLQERVTNGAGLVLALGDRSSRTDWAGTPREAMPIPPANPVDRSAGRGGTLGWIDRTHAALEAFAASRSGDLSAARFARYRPVSDTLGGRVLARFDDGSAALVERAVGRGRVLTWATGFGTEWSDFPRQPVFLPFIHELMRYAAGYRAPRASQVVGDVIDLDDALGAAGARTASQAIVAVSPSGKRDRFAADTGRRSLALDEAGFFALTGAGSPGSRPTLIAVNIDPRESELDTFDPVRLTGTATDVAADSANQAADTTLTREERERRQALWWWLLAAVTVVLGVEAVAAARAAGTQSRA
ncbi:MAG TPA: BatA and WFA domain-containing protein [Gemmatimonadaceae bacterium]|nr:BatA and WFA domain-containing protein [Gemmatimonadaceae bacterium]